MQLLFWEKRSAFWTGFFFFVFVGALFGANGVICSPRGSRNWGGAPALVGSIELRLLKSVLAKLADFFVQKALKPLMVGSYLGWRRWPNSVVRSQLPSIFHRGHFLALHGQMAELGPWVPLI